MELIESHDWPGNVRELEHVIEGAMNLSDGEWLTEHDLPASFIGSRSLAKSDEEALTLSVSLDLPLDQSILAYERQLLRHALMTCGTNVSDAAKVLGIPRQTLQYKIKKMNEKE